MAANNNKRYYQSSLLERRRTTSGSVPNWRRVISQGGDATTALSGTYVRAWLGGGNITATWPYDTSVKNVEWYTESVTGDFAFHGFGPPSGTSDASLEAEADTKAKIRLNKKVKDFSTRVQGGVILGELRETLSMLRSPAAALRKGLGEYLSTVKHRSRGARKKSSTISKVAAESWLEYSFGWVPLFHDIADATAAYKSLSRKAETIRIGAGGYAEKQLDRSSYAGAYMNYLYYRETYLYTSKAHVRYTGAVRVTAGVNSAAEVMDRFGLTFKEFVPTAWELIPWSFLVDYFTNIGDILSYDNSVNQNLAWLCRGLLYEERKMRVHAPDYEAARKVKFQPGSVSLVFSGSPSYAVFERRSVTRGKVSSLPSVSFADFRFDLPDYWKQFANIGALLGSANGVHPQRFRR